MSTTTQTNADRAAAQLLYAASERFPKLNIDKDARTINTATLALGLIPIGDEIDVTVVNKITGSRSVRHFHVVADDADLVAAVYGFCQGASA